MHNGSVKKYHLEREKPWHDVEDVNIPRTGHGSCESKRYNQLICFFLDGTGRSSTCGLCGRCMPISWSNYPNAQHSANNALVPFYNKSKTSGKKKILGFGSLVLDPLFSYNRLDPWFCQHVFWAIKSLQEAESSGEVPTHELPLNMAPALISADSKQPSEENIGLTLQFLACLENHPFSRFIFGFVHLHSWSVSYDFPLLCHLQSEQNL